mmetsp:Transcript_13029/g.33242  ORF Transcript_13029/g.33242 Transcript_13029/m.33242 type:complete len:258 (+) Transcript_13029:1672-2445(+)
MVRWRRRRRARCRPGQSTRVICRLLRTRCSRPSPPWRSAATRCSSRSSVHRTRTPVSITPTCWRICGKSTYGCRVSERASLSSGLSSSRRVEALRPHCSRRTTPWRMGRVLPQSRTPTQPPSRPGSNSSSSHSRRSSTCGVLSNRWRTRTLPRRPTLRRKLKRALAWPSSINSRPLCQSSHPGSSTPRRVPLRCAPFRSTSSSTRALVRLANSLKRPRRQPPLAPRCRLRPGRSLRRRTSRPALVPSWCSPTRPPRC